MAQATLRETLSRLYDELVAHERLCVDMIDVIIGATIRCDPSTGRRKRRLGSGDDQAVQETAGARRMPDHHPSHALALAVLPG